MSLNSWKYSDIESFTKIMIILVLSVFCGSCFVGVVLIGITVRNRNEKHDAGNLYGSAQYAELEEIREAGLLPPKGEKGKGVYVGGWINPKDGQQYYLRHNSKEHVIALASTRSGKGVGL